MTLRAAGLIGLLVPLGSVAAQEQPAPPQDSTRVAPIAVSDIPGRAEAVAIKLRILRTDPSGGNPRLYQLTL